MNGKLHVINNIASLLPEELICKYSLEDIFDAVINIKISNTLKQSATLLKDMDTDRDAILKRLEKNEREITVLKRKYSTKFKKMYRQRLSEKEEKK